jgi:hypothetical protein
VSGSSGVHMHEYSHTFIHTYTHIHTHVHIHTHTGHALALTWSSECTRACDVAALMQSLNGDPINTT